MWWEEKYTRMWVAQKIPDSHFLPSRRRKFVSGTSTLEAVGSSDWRRTSSAPRFHSMSKPRLSSQDVWTHWADDFWPCKSWSRVRWRLKTSSSVSLQGQFVFNSKMSSKQEEHNCLLWNVPILMISCRYWLILSRWPLCNEVRIHSERPTQWGKELLQDLRSCGLVRLVRWSVLSV